MKPLVDSYGRRIRKLRVSLTDRCNLRCHYCMPLDATFMEKSRYLKAEDYHQIISELCDFGLEEVRLTGGEPLMRASFTDITAKLSTLPLKKIGMTTNGILLDHHLQRLQDHRIHHLNISLDSFDPANFQKITHGDHLPRILKNIETAKAMGFQIKINMVAMRGVNDHEFFDFVDFSAATGIPVRFLELMRIGVACQKQAQQFISAKEIMERLQSKITLQKMAMDADSTSFNFTTDTGAQIGFIASESQAFCGQCSRWRLSADGIMRACLLKDDGLAVKNTTSEQRVQIYQQLLGMKPYQRPAEVHHLMHSIGG